MADTRTVAPYGTWTSPITVDHLAGDSIHFEGAVVNASTGQIYVLEARPSDGGRHALVDLTTDKDVLPAEYDVQGSIHEYGGGTATMLHDGRILFSSHPNNGVFLLDPTTSKVDTVLEPDACVRYGDFHVIPTTHDWVLAVEERHTAPDAVKDADVANTVVAIHLPTREVSTVLKGANFYEHPQFSPDGRQVCWTQWNHPDMPWTGTELYVAAWRDGNISEEHTLVSGQPGEESICQPRWAMDGTTLFYVSDKTGYWQLHKYDGQQSTHILLKGLEKAEFGSREPCLGNSTWVQLSETTLVASNVQNATSNLISIDLTTNEWTDLKLPLVDIQKNAVARISSTSFSVISSTKTTPQAIYRVDLEADGAKLTLLKRTIQHDLPSGVISEAQHITFPQVFRQTKLVSDPQGNAHAWFIPPKNDTFQAPDGTKPPLLVWMHGGPVYHVPPGLALEMQYWSSRGYAYVMVNHVGSTGYGRDYRAQLNGQWGAADIDDAASCVSYLREQGLVDPSRVGIVGESAGGYAVMQAVYLYPDLWAAGVALYGLSSLSEFAADTHKFESRYIDSLVLGTREGKTDEEIESIYRGRSALYHADRIKAPLLLLQGDMDTIVPSWQSTRMEEKMRELGKEVELVMYKGEGHGFHLDKTIKDATRLQEDFWQRKLLSTA